MNSPLKNKDKDRKCNDFLVLKGERKVNHFFYIYIADTSKI
jgi:hypothetical protein